MQTFGRYRRAKREKKTLPTKQETGVPIKNINETLWKRRRKRRGGGARA
jgi:hypothetical protein